MLNMIGLELKKILTKKSMIIFWAFNIFIAITTLRIFDLNDTYADLFNKFYGLAPLMGIMMFMIYANSYILEYESNMEEIIKSTPYGKKKIVRAKSIAYGLASSLINLSILGAMSLKVFIPFNFEKLNMPIKMLWYFGKSGSDITVIQMIMIMVLTLVLGSFFFAQLGLYLSSISRKAVIPFFIGGLLMGFPYLNRLLHISDKVAGFTPLWGMYSCQLIRYKIPTIAFGVFFIGSILGSLILYKFTCISFSKER